MASIAMPRWLRFVLVAGVVVLVAAAGLFGSGSRFAWHLLLLVQFVAVLWPPFYNTAEPYWHGVPFFYWYQLLWVLIGAVLTAVVYFATRP